MFVFPIPYQNNKHFRATFLVYSLSITAYLGDLMQSISHLEVLAKASTAMFIRRFNTTKANPSQVCDKHVMCQRTCAPLYDVTYTDPNAPPIVEWVVTRSSEPGIYSALSILGPKTCCAQLLLESTEPIHQCVNLARTWSLFILF